MLNTRSTVGGWEGWRVGGGGRQKRGERPERRSPSAAEEAGVAPVCRTLTPTFRFVSRFHPLMETLVIPHVWDEKHVWCSHLQHNLFIPAVEDSADMHFLFHLLLSTTAIFLEHCWEISPPFTDTPAATKNRKSFLFSAIILFVASIWLRLSALCAPICSACSVLSQFAHFSSCPYIFVLYSCIFVMLHILHT